MSFFNLFRPKFKNSDPNIRIVGVESINDEYLLLEIYENDSDQRVKEAALDRIINILKDDNKQYKIIDKIDGGSVTKEDFFNSVKILLYLPNKCESLDAIRETLNKLYNRFTYTGWDIVLNKAKGFTNEPEKQIIIMEFIVKFCFIGSEIVSVTDYYRLLDSIKHSYRIPSYFLLDAFKSQMIASYQKGETEYLKDLIFFLRKYVAERDTVYHLVKDIIPMNIISSM